MDDALEVLRQMHVEAKQTFQMIEDAGPDERAGLWARLRPELKLHEQLEDSFVYEPVARDVGQRDPMLARWEDEHEDQVQEVESTMDEIGRLDPADASWLHHVKELRRTLEQHMAHEENDIWPRIRAEWGDEKLQDIGGRMKAAKTAGEAAAAVSGAAGRAAEAIKGIGRDRT